MPSTALLDAIEASQAARPNQGLLLGFLNTCEKPSKSECSGILRDICTWKPRIKKQLEPCLVVLRWMARVKLEKIAPQMLKATTTWIDTVLVECLKAVRHRKEDEKEWARRHSTLLQLVLPAEHLGAVLDASGSMGHLVEDPVLICMLISSICVHIGCFPTRLLGAHWMFYHTPGRRTLDVFPHVILLGHFHGYPHRLSGSRGLPACCGANLFSHMPLTIGCESMLAREQDRRWHVDGTITSAACGWRVRHPKLRSHAPSPATTMGM